MQAELVECWLCEATLAPDGALIRYRDEQGMVHPWADRRGCWPPEYICSACALALDRISVRFPSVHAAHDVGRARHTMLASEACC